MHLEMQINTYWAIYEIRPIYGTQNFINFFLLDPAIFSYPEPDKPSARSTILFSYYFRVMKTNLNYLSSVYIVSQHLHVSDIFVDHH
jgi:hypothetical protein